MPPVLAILSFIFVCLPFSTTSRLQKRAICTVPSLGDPQKDDVPAIHAALQQCGDNGRILLPLGTTYHLRTPLDLSSCNACDFQLNGILKVADNAAFWQTQKHVIKAPNTTVAIIQSEGSTGIIDGNNSPGSPALFSILDSIYTIYIRSLTIRNVGGAAFYVRNTTGVRLEDVAFADAKAKVGILVDAARHVYLWNVTLKAKESCIRILTNSSNVQMEDSQCIIDAGTGNDAVQASGIAFTLTPSLLGRSIAWARNIWVKRTTFMGVMDVMSFVPGGEGTAEVFNATFTDVEVGGGVREAVRIDEEDGVRYNVSKILLRNWTGVATEKSELKCRAGEVCEFVKEGWSVVEG